MINSNQKLIAAAMISCASLLLVTSWYFFSEPPIETKLFEAPVAYVESSDDIILKKPNLKQQWIDLAFGEPIFDGETIRTGQNGNAELRFVGRSDKIQIESDSLVMIKKNEKNELTLDLVEGAIEVESLDKNNTLSLLSNNEIVKVEGALQIAKSGSGVEVSRADENITQTNQKNSQMISKNKSHPFFFKIEDEKILKFKITNPSKLPAYYFDDLKANKEKKVSFQISGLSSDYTKIIKYGIQRKFLNKESLFMDKKNEVSEAELVLQPGTQFFKIYIYKKSNLKLVAESKLNKINLEKRFKSEMIEPYYSEKFVISKNLKGLTAEVTFRWSKSKQIKNYNLQVSSSSDFSELILNSSFKDVHFYTSKMKKGIYYARVLSTHISDHLNQSSKIIMFEIVDEALNSNSVLSQLDLPLKMQEPEPTLKKIKWNLNSSTFLKKGADNLSSSFILNWTPESNNLKISKYEISIKPENPEKKPEAQDVNNLKIESNQLSAEVKVNKLGRYLASIQGFDHNNKLVAESDIKKLSYIELERLGAPHVQGESTKITNLDGNISLKFKLPENLKYAEFEIINKKKDFVKKIIVQKNQSVLKLSKLPPGLYEVAFSGIDQLDRRGEVLNLKIKSPEPIQLSAPKLKTIKVK